MPLSTDSLSSWQPVEWIVLWSYELYCLVFVFKSSLAPSWTWCSLPTHWISAKALLFDLSASLDRVVGIRVQDPARVVRVPTHFSLRSSQMASLQSQTCQARPTVEPAFHLLQEAQLLAKASADCIENRGHGTKKSYDTQHARMHRKNMKKYAALFQLLKMNAQAQTNWGDKPLWLTDWLTDHNLVGCGLRKLQTFKHLPACKTKLVGWIMDLPLEAWICLLRPSKCEGLVCLGPAFRTSTKGWQVSKQSGSFTSDALSGVGWHSYDLRREKQVGSETN